MVSKKKAQEMVAVMGRLFPDAHCELVFSSPLDLVIAVLLSAQATDVSVNKVTARLFVKYRRPEDYLAVSLEQLQDDIREIGLFRNKAKNIQALCRILLESYDGQVPGRFEDLVLLPGVGRKTANVVLSVGFGVPKIAVDTHVERVSKRLSMARIKDNVLEVEHELMRLLPETSWSQAHHQMIFFGRYFCTARSPKCLDCPLIEDCRHGRKLLKS